MNRWLATRLRNLADRIDYRSAPKCTGMSFTFEDGVGTRVRRDGKGCSLWYLGHDEYELAHTEADSAGTQSSGAAGLVNYPQRMRK